jgi:hypothetical protein
MQMIVILFLFKNGVCQALSGENTDQLCCKAAFGKSLGKNHS